ncbi:transcriptional regulator [Dehalococcoides mccartyi CG1]|nr:transcriptional regulator [Dehalococcoides mccartyi CG1]
MISLIIAALIGIVTNDVNEEPYLKQAQPSASSFQRLDDIQGSGHLYAAIQNEAIVGYITITESQGYGGPMTVVLGWSTDGVILNISIPNYNEDAAWFDSLYEKKYFDQYLGRNYTEPLIIDQDINAVSGSTISSKGVAKGVSLGRALLSQQMGHPYPEPVMPVKFGISEVMVLTGLVSSFFLRTIRSFKNYTWLRFLTLGFGLGVLGMWLVIPLSLTNFTALLLGNVGNWTSSLWIYVLMFGVLILAILFGKNYYCFWLCPFSAIQEGLHLITKISIRPDLKWSKRLRSLRYWLLWLSIFLALLLQNPSVTVFEPWNTLFPFSGSAFSWMLVMVTIIAATIIHNFWCLYACPVGAILDLTIQLRGGSKKLWQRIFKQHIATQQRT